MFSLPPISFPSDLGFTGGPPRNVFLLRFCRCFGCFLRLRLSKVLLLSPDSSLGPPRQKTCFRLRTFLSFPPPNPDILLVLFSSHSLLFAPRRVFSISAFPPPLIHNSRRHGFFPISPLECFSPSVGLLLVPPPRRRSSTLSVVLFRFAVPSRTRPMINSFFNPLLAVSSFPTPPF